MAGSHMRWPRDLMRLAKFSSGVECGGPPTILSGLVCNYYDATLNHCIPNFAIFCNEETASSVEVEFVSHFWKKFLFISVTFIEYFKVFYIVFTLFFYIL